MPVCARERQHAQTQSAHDDVAASAAGALVLAASRPSYWEALSRCVAADGPAAAPARPSSLPGGMSLELWERDHAADFAVAERIFAAGPERGLRPGKAGRAAAGAPARERRRRAWPSMRS